ncbi:hypothetical protein KIPB_010530 [Kipferlia bialata]|uniref:Uncharacterized protein n=1 Tax=Kipferlia bialata TaxID=797122 RepID=A0A9K3D5B1_9EUKA|nr:hypothetical protein KIPB_010530 [Kipferlia bialata]|eukprot:g10530.t1
MEETFCSVFNTVPLEIEPGIDRDTLEYAADIGHNLIMAIDGHCPVYQVSPNNGGYTLHRTHPEDFTPCPFEIGRESMCSWTTHRGRVYILVLPYTNIVDVQETASCVGRLWIYTIDSDTWEEQQDRIPWVTVGSYVDLLGYGDNLLLVHDHDDEKTHIDPLYLEDSPLLEERWTLNVSLGDDSTVLASDGLVHVIYRKDDIPRHLVLSPGGRWVMSSMDIHVPLSLLYTQFHDRIPSSCGVLVTGITRDDTPLVGFWDSVSDDIRSYGQPPFAVECVCPLTESTHLATVNNAHRGDGDAELNEAPVYCVLEIDHTAVYNEAGVL